MIKTVAVLSIMMGMHFKQNNLITSVGKEMQAFYAGMILAGTMILFVLLSLFLMVFKNKCFSVVV